MPLKIVRNDITAMEVDAIVSSAGEDLSGCTPDFPGMGLIHPVKALKNLINRLLGNSDT